MTFCIVNVLCAGDEVFIRMDEPRGVRAKRAFKVGEFVMEFEGNLLSKEENEVAEKEYEEDGQVQNFKLKFPKSRWREGWP